jgi:hypothetical protein
MKTKERIGKRIPKEASEKLKNRKDRSRSFGLFYSLEEKARGYLTDELKMDSSWILLL